MISRFWGALQFLTVWPIRGKTASIGEAAVFFPIVGALLGASAGVVLFVSNQFLSKPVSALLAVAWLVTVTGCLHEDGLADVADAFRAGRTREKMMLILKDSRIGTYGAVSLTIFIALRWQALAECRINAIYGLAAAVALSRAALVVLGKTTDPVGDGLGREFAATISRAAFVATAVQAILISFIAGWRYALVMLVATTVVLIVARAWFLRRLGGVNGDCLGAACQAVETINLVILTCRLSS